MMIVGDTLAGIFSVQIGVEQWLRVPVSVPHRGDLVDSARRARTAAQITAAWLAVVHDLTIEET